MLATLVKRSKHTYCSSFLIFFQNHINDKGIIYLKDSSSTVPSTIVEDNTSLTNPKNIAGALITTLAVWRLVLNLP